MFTDHYKGVEEYPFTGEFYRLEVDEDLPLNQQRPMPKVYFTTVCDITEASHTRYSNFVAASFAVFFPFDKENDKIIVKRGDMFRGDQYGLEVNGKVVGVFPSQLGGCVAYVNDTDV